MDVITLLLLLFAFVLCVLATFSGYVRHNLVAAALACGFAAWIINLPMLHR